jgi:hypothetical protein
MTRQNRPYSRSELRYNHKHRGDAALEPWMWQELARKFLEASIQHPPES